MRTEQVKLINRNNLHLSVVIHKPDSDGKYPTVILLHGFTGYKDEEHVKKLAEELAKHGYCAVRFDASGFADSEGTPEKDFRPTNYLHDIESVYDYMKKQDYVDTQRLGIWGHSIGGFLSLIFTVTHSDIKAVCAVSPCFKFIQIHSSTPMQTWKETGWFEKEKPGMPLIRIPYEFVEDMDSYNLNEYLPQVHVPILIILGKQDTVVDPDDTRRIFNTLNTKKELIEVDSMGHDYKKYPELVKQVNAIIVPFYKKYL